MFCRNCGFKTKDQGLTECPECNYILSPDSPDDDEDKDAEELFGNFDNILNGDELDNDNAPEDTEPTLPEEDKTNGREAELAALNKNTNAIEGSGDDKTFELDFETEEQSEKETAGKPQPEEATAGTDEQIDEIIEDDIIEETGPAAEADPQRENIEEPPEFEDEEDDDDDEVEQETEPKESSKTAPVLLFIFFLIIAAGAGVFYLKTKQPPAPPVQKVKALKKEDKILKSILKKDENQLAVKTEAKKALSAKPVAEKPAKAPEALPPEKEPVVKKEIIAVKKKTDPQQKKPEVKISAKKKKSSAKGNFWINYVPGKQPYHTIQISSIATRSYAESNLNLFKRKGYPAYIILTKNREGQLYYKLRIGKYKTAADAKKAADNFYKKEKIKYIIVNSNAAIAL